MSEDQIQAQIYRRAWNEMPWTRRLLFAVPNGGSRHLLEAVKLKATGLIAGIPDMIQLWEGRAYGIEVKEPGKGRLSEAQKIIHEAWSLDGTPVYVVWSVEQALDKIREITNNGRRS